MCAFLSCAVGWEKAAAAAGGYADALVISVPFFPFPSQHHPSTDLAAAFFLLRRDRLMTNNPSLGN
jgi:hypothetical protein